MQSDFQSTLVVAQLFVYRVLHILLVTSNLYSANVNLFLFWSIELNIVFSGKNILPGGCTFDSEID